ncbi:MAG: hypothetical protein CSA34_00315 [Desulfobulbus propionicus]|nr:MAG: hypothetical protein CSA34_00315 [Desulfobulbus propionicus]
MIAAWTSFNSFKPRGNDAFAQNGSSRNPDVDIIKDDYTSLKRDRYRDGEKLIRFSPMQPSRRVCPEWTPGVNQLKIFASYYRWLAFKS